jgi:hypothetical protein
MLTLKQCIRCKRELSYDEFYSHATNKNGLRGECKKCSYEVNRVWRNKNKEQFDNTTRNYVNKNREKIRKYQNGWHLNFKKILVDAYGGKCSCCGESEIRFLTLEHKNRGGSAHRKQVGGGRNVYQDVKRQGYPKDKYEILCFNCNCSQSNGQPCPHKNKRVDVILNAIKKFKEVSCLA